MNTKWDNYIDSLEVWDMIQYDWLIYQILKMDSYNVTINIEWELEEVSFSEILEEWESTQAEERIQDQVDLAINQNKDDY